MKKRIATLCCLLVIESSVAIAGETGNSIAPSSATVTPYESGAGPLRRASLSKTPWTLRSKPASNHRQDQDPAAAPDPDTRSWAARHPVWTGAMVGFSAGSLITYAATASEQKNELFDFSGLRGAAVLTFGGISAGIGALAGWGVGRSQHDGYHDRARIVEKSSRRSRR